MTQPLFYFLLGVGASILALCLWGFIWNLRIKTKRLKKLKQNLFIQKKTLL